MNEFRLDGSVEAFDNGVIPAIPFATHAAKHFVLLEKIAKCFARILASAIRMIHQTCNALAANPYPISSQLSVNTRTSVRAGAYSMNKPHEADQFFINLSAFGGEAFTPCIISGLRYLEKTAHHADAKIVRISLDACISYFHSLAKKAVAFFKKSRSSVIRLSSRRRRCSSSSC